MLCPVPRKYASKPMAQASEEPCSGGGLIGALGRNRGRHTLDRFAKPYEVSDHQKHSVNY